MKAPKGLKPETEPLWRFLKDYRFRARWRDPCAYPAEIHGALTVLSRQLSAPRGGRPGRAQRDPFGNVLVNVSTPQSEADLPRILQGIEADRPHYDGGLFVVIVTKWYQDAKALRALKRELEGIGATVLIKSTPPPRVGTARRRGTTVDGN